MEYEIERINAWSVIKIVFLISFFAGALIGIFYALILSTVSNLFQHIVIEEIGNDIEPLGTYAIFIMIVFLAIFVSIANSIISVVLVGSYNLLSQWIGGIKFDLKLSDEAEYQISDVASIDVNPDGNLLE